MAKKPSKSPKNVEALRHTGDKRMNIPTAEHQSVLAAEDAARKEVRYPRNTDLDPQLVWRGKDYQDWSDLVVQAPPLYIQEKVHPKVLIDDLLREPKGAKAQESGAQFDLFGDFNGVPDGADKTDFYQHDQNWTNRMILGDSLQVMASLAEREGLRGKVQCIYIDPPYGIKFNSNFQWSTTSRDSNEERANQITREPEQVKAFRDTWREGIHTYLTYLRDRLTVARDILNDSGSVFVQIGDENVHRVRAVLDEVFGDTNCVAQIAFTKTTSSTSDTIPTIFDTLLWYAKDATQVKVRRLYLPQTPGEEGAKEYKRVETIDGLLHPISRFTEGSGVRLPDGARIFATGDISSKGGNDPDIEFPSSRGPVRLSCKPNRHWKTGVRGTQALWSVGRLLRQPGLRIYKRYFDDFPFRQLTNVWTDTRGEDDPRYVVQTDEKPVQRCLLMSTDPGDIVLDPTCGSGTTAVVAEEWGRRWITIDTSRVALALARTRLMSSRYPFYILSDSLQGLRKEAELSRRAPVERATFGAIRQGFICERASHITPGVIAANSELPIILERWASSIDGLLARLNKESRNDWQDWEVPPAPADDWSPSLKTIHGELRQAILARQLELNESIMARGGIETLHDRPIVDPGTVRVAGPFTVESLSPHRTMIVDENDELVDPHRAGGAVGAGGAGRAGDGAQSFEQMILDNLRMAGVQQAHKEDRITFTSLTPWPGAMVCGEGRYREGDTEKRAAVFIGPEFGTVSRPDLVAAAREAGDAGFDVLIACAFNYEAHASEFNKLGRIPVLKARMNADLHMGGELKATGKGNLFVIFGEPDIDILHLDDGTVRVHVKGVDVFDPSTGEVRSDGADGIACWFIDTDYNEESFFVRHAYFLGQNEPYGALKTTLKAEIDADVWATLNKDISRPFPLPKSGRIAVKVINHLGDEVMKVFRVE